MSLAAPSAVTQKSAWFMLHRIRLAMQSGSFEKLDGAVEVDETFIGGKARNMHRSRKARPARDRRHGQGAESSASAQRDGEIRATVVPDVEADDAAGRADPRERRAGSAVYTDADALLQWVCPRTSSTRRSTTPSNTSRGSVHTNGLENFWALLKRGLSGTYVSVRALPPVPVPGRAACSPTTVSPRATTPASMPS